MDSPASTPHAFPAGLLVHGRRDELERAFGRIAALQPVRWTGAGLVCAPRAAVELAAPILADCPFAVTALNETPAWPDPPAQMTGGWYRRGLTHLPAPAGIRELVQVPGDGFGWGGHHTTAMCLASIEDLPVGPAVDAGCGSGLLCQAWLRLGRGPVLAIDSDPAAVAQTTRSLAAAGLAGAQVACRDIATLTSDELASRVILANIPESAQWALRKRIAGHTPAAVLMSGLRPGAAAALVASYRVLGLRPRRALRRGRWECWVLCP